MFENYMPAAPAMEVLLNVGCLFDIPTGEYYLGEHGESILNGGVAPLNGVVGRGNNFKTTIAIHLMLAIMSRYRRSFMSVYDTENTLTSNRIYRLAQHMPYIGGVALVEEGRLHMSNLKSGLGDVYFDKFKESLAIKKKDPKQFLRTTPFLTRSGDPIKCLYPTVYGVDSFSMFTTTPVVTQHDENSIGESGNNTDNMRDSLIKNQMLMQLPYETSNGGAYMFLTGHVGDGIPLNPKAPPPRKLTFLKGDNTKIKNVPEKFTFLMNNCWQCMNATVLQAEDKTAEYPINPGDTVKGDTDLQAVTVTNLRSKNGPSGHIFKVLVSQRDGVLVGLTELNYLKEMGRYGLGGNVQNYFLELYPEATLSRTKVRQKIREDDKLKRALEITSEMCQMENHWHDMEPGLLCTPKQLYDDLKAKGYDWDVLLQTRGYWIFKEDEELVKEKFCSTMDMLRMRAGLYHPWWMAPLPTK